VVLDAIPDVYQLTPSSVWALREQVILALRVDSARTASGVRRAANNKQQCEKFANDLMTVYDKVFAETPELLKDLLDSYMCMPLLGRCNHCGPDQPAGPLQMKCLTCGKGGVI